MIVNGAENPAFARELLDRTEGKVADKLISLERKVVNIRIELTHNPLTLPSQTIEGQVVTEHALDQVSSVEKAIEGQAAWDRVHASGSHQGDVAE